MCDYREIFDKNAEKSLEVVEISAKLIVGNPYSCISTITNDDGKQITVSFTQIFTGISGNGDFLFTSDKKDFPNDSRGIERVTSYIEICSNQ